SPHLRRVGVARIANVSGQDPPPRNTLTPHASMARRPAGSPGFPACGAAQALFAGPAPGAGAVHGPADHVAGLLFSDNMGGVGLVRSIYSNPVHLSKTARPVRRTPRCGGRPRR